MLLRSTQSTSSCLQTTRSDSPYRGEHIDPMRALYPLTMSQLLADGHGESLYRWVITTIPYTTICIAGDKKRRDIL